jgi:hypothetical protein
LSAFLPAFGKSFLVDMRLFDINLRPVQHGLNLLAGEMRLFVDQDERPCKQ